MSQVIVREVARPRVTLAVIADLRKTFECWKLNPTTEMTITEERMALHEPVDGDHVREILAFTA